MNACCRIAWIVNLVYVHGVQSETQQRQKEDSRKQQAADLEAQIRAKEEARKREAEREKEEAMREEAKLAKERAEIAARFEAEQRAEAERKKAEEQEALAAQVAAKRRREQAQRDEAAAEEKREEERVRREQAELAAQYEAEKQRERDAIDRAAAAPAAAPAPISPPARAVQPSPKTRKADLFAPRSPADAAADQGPPLAISRAMRRPVEVIVEPNDSQPSPRRHDPPPAAPLHSPSRFPAPEHPSPRMLPIVYPAQEQVPPPGQFQPLSHQYRQPDSRPYQPTYDDRRMDEEIRKRREAETELQRVRTSVKADTVV